MQIVIIGMRILLILWRIMMKEKLINYKNYLINIRRSLVNYNYLRPFFNYLEDNKIDFYKLTKDELANYFKVKNYKPKAINSVLTAGRDFCKYENITEHASFQIKLLEVEVRERQYITYEELLNGIKQYATYSTRGMNSMKCSVVLKFMFFTSIRKGELLTLTRDKVDLTNCSALIWGQKDKAERIVYFPDNFVKELTDYFNSEPEEKNAFNITLMELNHLVKKIGKYINKKISPHSLRHAGAKYMVTKNVSPITMQRIMGHNSLTTTLIYCKIDDKQAQDIYRKQIG
jgi:integrase/recombinase XerD